MPTTPRLVTTLWLTALALGLVVASRSTSAGDLPAVGDGRHVWFVEQAPPPDDDQDAGPELTIYHLPTDTKTHFATKLDDPIAGELMPRGIAAGDGRLLLINTDRQLVTLRPVWSDLLLSWNFQRRTLAALPEGCTLLSLTMGDRGPWALVRVQSRELLERLDEVEQARPPGRADQRMLNKALGLPEGLEWGEAYVAPSDDDRAGSSEAQTDESEDESEDESSTNTEVDTEANNEARADARADLETAAAADADAQRDDEAAMPAFRLIQLRGSRWVSSPLPADFVLPREARLVIRPGDERPTVLVDNDSRQRRTPMLVRYTPIELDRRSVDDASGDASANDSDDAPADGDTEGDVDADADASAWARVDTGMQLGPGRQWSAGLVNDQIVIALERVRPKEVVTVDAFWVRDGNAYEVGSTDLPAGENARWSLFPWQRGIGLLVSPPPTDKAAAASGRMPAFALLAGLGMNGEPMFQSDQGEPIHIAISERTPDAFEGNADLIIQILAFITAMIMMVMFYRRAPQQGQLDLPDDLVLAGFGRRIMAGVIDLTPGFVLAGLIYDVTIGQVIFESWPGNGIEKAFVAMRPGFLVIGVTLLHTAVCEFFLTRSLGKILLGMYVSDLHGKPASPLPCLGRALSRAFEMFAPLMILVAVISPARQRLGDILAKTTVVMRKPEADSEEESSDS